MKNTVVLVMILTLMVAVAVNAGWREPSKGAWMENAAGWKPGEFTISPLIGYAFGDDYNVNYSEDRDHTNVELDEDITLGMRFGFGIARGVGLELQLSHMPSALYFNDHSYYEPSTKLTDVDLTTIQTAIMIDFVRGPVIPYFGMGVGGTVLDFDKGDSRTRLTGSMMGGLKIRITRNMAFRTEMRGLAIRMDEGDSYNCNDRNYYRDDDDYLRILEMTMGLMFRF